MASSAAITGALDAAASAPMESVPANAKLDSFEASSFTLDEAKDFEDEDFEDDEDEDDERDAIFAMDRAR